MLENGATSDLATKAAEDLLKAHNVNAENIDVIIVATITPDMFFPATACLVQENIGAKNAWGCMQRFSFCISNCLLSC